ncbi:MAG: hypothetical protein ACK5PB_03970 [Pirellula sp.]|jgi:hypothetical protein
MSLGVPSEAFGQLIGNRTVGTAPGFNQPRTPGGNPGSANNLSPPINGRFVRGNRSRNDFVGSNRTEQTGFVGSTQAIGVGRVQSAVEGLRATSQRSVNRPLPAQPSTGLYYPKLEIDFKEKVASQKDEQSARVETVFLEAQGRVSNVSGAKVSVVRVGELAIVRGEVPDERTADLIVMLLGFEPGLDQVRNEMQILEMPEAPH